MVRIVKFLRGSKAAAAPYVAVLLVLLLIITGVVIDLGHIYVVKQELQSAAEAGALAGARALFSLENPDDPQPAYVRCDLAHAAALSAVQLNKTDGLILNIPAEDVQVGMWEYVNGKWQFRPQATCTNDINAVQVITRRTAAVNGPVNLIFASFLGKEWVELTAKATAMLGWLTALPDGLGFPLALGKSYVPQSPGQEIPVTFSPDWSDAGGWHCFKSTSADANELRSYINKSLNSIGIQIGDSINCLNGVAQSVINETDKMLKTYNSKGEDWIVYLPVIDASKYNQWREVLGFCAFRIENVDKNTHAVSGKALGMYTAPDMGSSPTNPSPDNSLRSKNPRLVE
jgi:Flp pilus assembly protein TadG|uniref:Flp pilus-assembly TadG-like N-terminal domain-containing protein n=1 Tax=Desulfobacca acetoxidans TaxID=60893 RepID=A0A7C3SHG1_9BACT